MEDRFPRDFFVSAFLVVGVQTVFMLLFGPFCKQGFGLWWSLACLIFWLVSLAFFYHGCSNFGVWMVMVSIVGFPLALLILGFLRVIFFFS